MPLFPSSWRIYLCLLLPWLSATQAQVVSPTSIDFGAGDPLFTTGEQVIDPVSITLPGGEVDVFFLLDDTGSIGSDLNVLAASFPGIDAQLRSMFPGADFGYGVGRFEDYGGLGASFGGNSDDERPFILNQPIATDSAAGSQADLLTLIQDALLRSSSGGGGDLPESAIAEGLLQVATGRGFDGNGDDTTNGIDGLQTLLADVTQTTPDASGDVPAFAVEDVPADIPFSGSVGGAGFREDALKLVILATDNCPVAAFANDEEIPEEITSEFATVPTEQLVCPPGENRFGFVSNSLSAPDPSGSVVPLGAGTVPETVDELTARGIRVLGLAAEPPENSEEFDPTVFLEGMASLTGAVDDEGEPLVTPLIQDAVELARRIVNLIEQSITPPIDIELDVSDCDDIDDLSVTVSPDEVEDVRPGGFAEFEVEFNLLPIGFIDEECDLIFRNADTDEELGTIPVTLDGFVGGNCDDFNPCDPEITSENGFYFTAENPTNFIQCDAFGGCWVQPCAPGTVWNQDVLTCTFG